jgi:hypothetical protein
MKSDLEYERRCRAIRLLGEGFTLDPYLDGQDRLPLPIARGLVS